MTFRNGIAFLTALSVFGSAAPALGQSFFQELTPPSGGMHVWFAQSLAIDGTTLAVGDPEFRKQSTADHCPGGYGAVQIFKRTSSGSWAPSQATLMHTPGSSENKLGRSLALRGSVLVASAERENYVSGATTIPGAGAIYVYRRASSSAEFTLLARVFSPNPQRGVNLGGSGWFSYVSGVATNGTYVVGAEYPTSPNINVYQVQSSGVVHVSTIALPSGAAASKLFITDQNVLVAMVPGYAMPLAYALNGSAFTPIDTTSLGEFGYGTSHMAGDGDTVALIKASGASSPNRRLQWVKFGAGTLSSHGARAFPLGSNARNPSSVAMEENQGIFIGYQGQPASYVVGYKYFGGVYNYGGTFDDGAPYGISTSDAHGTSIAYNGTDLIVGDPYKQRSGNLDCFAGPVAQNGSAFVVRPIATSVAGTGQSRQLRPWMHAQVWSHGRVVATNGTFLAAGSSAADDIGDTSGEITLYKNVSGSWQHVERYGDGDAGFGGATNNSSFGFSTDLSADVLAIGAPSATNLQTMKATGLVYLARATNGVFESGPFLTSVPAPTPHAFEGCGFGASVALSGNRLVVGAPVWSTSLTSTENRGSAYVFDWNGSSWVLHSRLIGSGAGTASERFGTKVAVNGDYVIVGIPGRDVGSRVDAGAVHIFRRSGSSYVSAAEFSAPASFANSANFGNQVSIGPNYAAASSMSGSMVLYRRSGTSWSEDGGVLTPGAATWPGPALAFDGDVLFVGSPGDRAVYRYTRGTSWSRVATLTGPNSGAFGTSLDVSAGLLAIGSAGTTVGLIGSGAAYSVGGTQF